MHQNPINKEIQEDNYTQPPFSSQYTRKPYLILMMFVLVDIQFIFVNSNSSSVFVLITLGLGSDTGRKAGVKSVSKFKNRSTENYMYTNFTCILCKIDFRKSKLRTI